MSEAEKSAANASAPTDMERALWRAHLGKSRLPLVAHTFKTRGLSSPTAALRMVEAWEASGALTPAWPAPVACSVDIGALGSPGALPEVE